MSDGCHVGYYVSAWNYVASTGVGKPVPGQDKTDVYPYISTPRQPLVSPILKYTGCFISEQNLVDCVSDGCHVGYYVSAWNYVASTGVGKPVPGQDKTDVYPYLSTPRKPIVSPSYTPINTPSVPNLL